MRLITDILISLDDLFMYFVNRLHGDIRQYNIEDPKNPVLNGQVWVGGRFQKGSSIVVTTEDGGNLMFQKYRIVLLNF
jgi:methanethiol oxidase